jgi:hypothetical protein
MSETGPLFSKRRTRATSPPSQLPVHDSQSGDACAGLDEEVSVVPERSLEDRRDGPLYLSALTLANVRESIVVAVAKLGEGLGRRKPDVD